MSSSSPRATPRSPRGAASVDSSGSVQRSRSRILPRASSSSSSSSSSSYKGTMPKVYLISDVHFDGQNRAFIEHMPNKKDENSILVVAGDVGEKLDDVERCFRLCTKKFDTVFYSFGNHELWCTNERDERCSYEKIKSVFDVCEKCGVKTNPSEEIPVENQGENARQAVFIAPVHSWYEQEFDTEDDVEAPDDVTIPKVEKVMTDYRLCKWPSLEEWKKEMTMEKISSNSSSARNTTAKTYSNDYYISRKIDALNDEDGKFERFLENVKRAKMEGKDVTVITFSHFLPRIELIPEKRFLLYPKLTQAVGSHILNERVERVTRLLHLGESGKDKHTHAFGHTHFGWNLVLENNVRYVQAALATPKEWVRRPRSLVVGDFFSNAPGNAPLLLYDVATNAFSGSSTNEEYNPGLWAKYYEENARDPSNKTLAPWVLEYVSRIWGSRELKKSMMMSSNAEASPLPGKSGEV